MSYQEKYSLSKRGQISGPFTALEVIDLLRMKEISTIHKVKLGKDWLTVSDFIDQHEKGLLPEQNLDQVFKDEPEEEEVKKEEEETVEIPEPEPEPKPEPVEKVIEVPKPGPATEIHINRSGTQFGPYLLKELKDYLKAGNLRFSDLVWFEGVSEWVPLSRIPGVADDLSSLGSAAPPPPKPPPVPAAPTALPPPVQSAPSTPSLSSAKQSNTVLTDSGQSAEKEVDEDEVTPDKPSLEIENIAPHGARAIAGIVDSAILLLVVLILIGTAGAFSDFNNTLYLAGVCAYFLLGWLYYGLGESSQAGGFIGKRISKIKVVRLADDEIPGFGVSSLRAVLKILISLTIILPFIVFLTPRRQGLHDLACGTIVKSEGEEN